MGRRVLKKLSPLDDTTALGLNPLCEIDRRAMVATKDCVKVAVVRVKGSRESPDIGDAGSEIGHNRSMVFLPIQCKIQPDGFLSHVSHSFDMETWHQRENFKASVKAYRVNNRLKLSDVAAALGLAEDTLKDYLYRKDVKPGLEVLQQACTLFGCKITEYVDDPGMDLPGIESGELGELTPAKRLILRSVAQKISPEDVTDEAAEKVWRALDSLKQIR